MSRSKRDLDRGALAAWLGKTVDPAFAAGVSLTKLPGGHSSGAWRVDAVSGALPTLVLKAPEQPSVVFRRDVCREGRVIDALGRAGVLAPSVVAIDDVGAVGRPCFVTEHVAGRSPADTAPGSYHADEWLRDAGPAFQRAAWSSFLDALAVLHSIDPATVPDLAVGTTGCADVLDYWRESLLDVVAADAVPRQLALLDWLGEHLPADADARPAVCMGDARFVNCILDGSEVRALIDFEVAYVGNPAADVGYCVFLDESSRRHVDTPLPGIGRRDETWDRWSSATGRRADEREYWTAFGATVLCITATRAMVQWGLAGPSVEDGNPVVASWEALADQAGRG